MGDLAQHLVKRLMTEGDKIANFFRSLSAEDLERVIYADGMSWNAKQVLLHLVSTEESVFQLIQDIYQGGMGVPADFDIDSFNQKQIQLIEFTTVEDMTRSFLVRRRQVADFVVNLSEADLKKEGRHPFLGIAPLEEIIRLLYRHPQIHVRDIKQTIHRDL